MRYFNRLDIPYPHKMEPFLEDHLEHYLSPHRIKGNYWFVDAAATGGADGKTWANAFTTITAAIAAASAWDAIFVAGGDYDEGAVMNITLEGLKIIGPGSQTRQVALVYASSASHHVFTINAHNVEIAGLGIYQTKNNYDGIRIATTASFFKTWIHDCWFNGNATGEYGIHTGTTYDSPDTIIENCQFKSWATECLHCNGTRSIYRNNIFIVDASTIGIEFVPNTGDRGDQMLIGNIIQGSNSGDTGIKITNAPSAGLFSVIGNIVVNCATSITTGKGDNMFIENYVSNATGGTLFDPSP